jgi:tRNA synthetases class II (D, K and N)
MAIDPRYIDYSKLALGLEFYQSRGYGYIEAPWLVSRAATNVTLPEDREVTHTQFGDLVGSGEQSFIELMMRGMTIDKACCITPCFRDEPDYDELHHAYFMKLELIDTDATEENLQHMISDAVAFLGTFLDVHVIPTGESSYDIVDNRHELELGSYGFRQFGSRRFIYGTGIALPRLDTVRLLA